MTKPVYRRVLLKISGEALAGDKHAGLSGVSLITLAQALAGEQLAAGET